MTDTTKLLPVTLPSWPTCRDCLSWSKDHLAVAGGDYIYILTPKNPALRLKVAGHSQWHVLTVRANLFRQDEWPDQVPATLGHASIGEEQSSSRVTALSWSPSGLGMHRHSILGVLTSNLVLSFWETDGSQEKFERTCIVNKQLAPRADYKETRQHRRKLRVRAFAWLPPVITQTQSRWGTHHLLIATDNGALILFRVSKKLKTSLGTWILEHVLQHEQPNEEPAISHTTALSPLQRRLYEHAPITKLLVSSWKELQTPSEDILGRKMVVRVAIQRGVLAQTKLVSLTLTIMDDTLSFAFGEYLQDQNSADTGREPAFVVLEGRDAHALEDGSDPQTFFGDSLQPFRDDYDSTYQLAGHHRVRWWGTATSQDGSKVATCVTLHPSDMIEYIIPSAEKCILVFKRIGQDHDQMAPVSRPAASVQQEIVTYALTQSGKNSTPHSSLDRKMLLTYASLGTVVLDPGSELRTSLESTAEELTGQSENNRQGPHSDHISIDGQEQDIEYVFGTPEDCEICGAVIPLTNDTSGAVCRSGHRFSRCQLSFLAIQQPGISKYCTQCGKQFLDLMKLGSTEGQSFAQTMFDEFDVCPYCQANFRG